MRQLFFTALLLSCVVVNAQKQTVKFSNIISIGWLKGSSQDAFTIQTINGIKVDKWRFGIGVGMDNYGAKSIPLFVDVRKVFGSKKWQPLVYADAGVDMPLYYGNLDTKVANNQRVYELHNGFYGETGIGFSRKISKKTSLNITAGFSYKHLSYTQNNIAYMFSSASSFYPYDAYTQFDYYYRRLALKVGLQF